MYRSDGNRVRLAPLCIHSFRVIVPRSFEDKKAFNTKYRFYEDIDNVPSRLKWCRMHLGLEQKEVAAQVGISEGQYSDMEIGKKDYIPKDTADKLARLYNVPVTDLLNDYARFLYYGQGKAIRGYRQSLGMGERPFAKFIGTDICTLRAWEREEIGISMQTWGRCFKDVIKTNMPHYSSNNNEEEPV
ncbi:MAG: helix-turn-helix transcriptional regulator [Clostridia bacterium]|nr:helix-turn-helix transcriptional regulator [Clostridia bacterium]